MQSVELVRVINSNAKMIIEYHNAEAHTPLSADKYCSLHSSETILTCSTEVHCTQGISEEKQRKDSNVQHLVLQPIEQTIRKQRWQLPFFFPPFRFSIINPYREGKQSLCKFYDRVYPDFHLTPTNIHD